MVDITAKAEGPVKIIAINDVKNFVNGKPMIGAMIREFEVKATKNGPAKILVTINNTIQKTTDIKEFNIDIQ